MDLDDADFEEFAMRRVVLAALALASVGSAVNAQDTASSNGTSFRGFRIEGNAGYDWAHSEGRSNSKFAYGGSAGFDGQFGNIVVGPEFTYWHPNKSQNTVVGPVAGGTMYHQQRDQLSGDVRIGYLVTPDVLVFGKGGYVNESQRRLLVTSTGQRVGFGRGRADGYQYGGGAEFTLHDKVSAVPGGVYVSAQYVRSQFDNHTHDDHAMGGIGFRFR